MLTEEQIREALRPLVKQETTLDMLLAIGMDEYLAIEQAVRKEMEGDVKDAERYRWLRDKTEWEPFDSSWLFKVDLYGGEAVDMDTFIDAAKGQT